jgi:16S rRNA (cytosine1402-N4)-methyltransferase
MTYHVPVLLSETLDSLNVVEDGLYFDGTLGGGGHSQGILDRGGRLIATDLDIEAIEQGKKRFAAPQYAGKFVLIKDNFKNFLKILDEQKVDKIDGALFDLGISSHQVDKPTRGFSYRYDAPLDMRMNEEQSFSAYDVINGYSPEKLEKILFGYGEERFARRIVKNIVEERSKSPILTTGKLCEIIKASVPAAAQKNGNPCKKTFQAVRIEVNGELDGLDELLSDVISKLKTGGRLCVITFHSLEDRIVKQNFKLNSTDCICDKRLPVCVCNHKATVREIAKIKPSESEIQLNGRSASATLRVVEKI